MTGRSGHSWQQRLAAPSLAAALLLAACLSPAIPAVPAPPEMAADVTVSGHTSTARRVDIIRTGDEIPKTFSGDRVKNTPGFSWWVSRHYALKTDYPEEKARFHLTLLEMAYPHYAELFGRDVPDAGETRMAVCYASSKGKLRRALASDGLTWDFDGGGITFEGYKCAYQYPSGTLDYHKRYILLHECTHLYQMCLNGSTYTSPSWYREGVADSLSSHVYDTARRQLTVHVFDKPTTHDYFDEGMVDYRKAPLAVKQIHDQGSASRGMAFLLAHFFLDDPDRCQRFRLWRDGIFRLNQEHYQERSEQLLLGLFGSWEKMNADFAAWVGSVRNTFHYAEWGWEQEADTLWSYGFAKDNKFSQTDVYLPPGETPEYRPWRMDYPLQPMSPLVESVRRGVEEPSVGCLVDFSRCPGRGVAGFGLGLEGNTPGSPQCLQVLIEEGKQLVLAGKDLGLENRSEGIPPDVRAAAAAAGHRFGLTVRIAKETLHVTLRAGDEKAAGPAEFKTALPLEKVQRERLLTRPLTILSRNGWHGVTPYFDDRRRPEPDLRVPAPPNRWRNPGDKPLAALYRAAWALGDKTPASLRRLKETMLAATDQGPAAQKEAVGAFEKQARGVVKDIRACGADDEAVRSAAEILETLSPPPAE